MRRRPRQARRTLHWSSRRGLAVPLHARASLAAWRVSGGRPVEASTQRAYGTGSPFPKTSIATSHIVSRLIDRPRRYGPRSQAIFRASSRIPAIARGRLTLCRYSSMAWRLTLLPDTAPLARRIVAAGSVYASGRGSSENHESAMNRPGGTHDVTAHNVSMPSTASATLSFLSNATSSPAMESLSGSGLAQIQHSVDLS